MGFKITNKEGISIGIKDLDAEVAELWGFKTEDKRQFALEKNEDECDSHFEYITQSNWFDIIGWMLSEGKSFQGILDYYATKVFVDFLGDVDEDGNVVDLKYIIPKKVLLLETWIAKGYVPSVI